MISTTKESCENLSEKKKQNCCSSCKKYFVEFTSNTSLHGLRYIGEEGRPLFEKIWWFIMVGLSLAGCTHLIYKLYVKWDQNPVIVSFGETSMPIWQVPFPAITICSETKSRQTVFNFTDAHYRVKNLTEEELMQYETVSLVCNNHALTKGSETTNDEAINFLSQVAPQMDDTMFDCLWRTYRKNCSKIFTHILTEEGICFTFNMLDAKELFRNNTLQDNYKYLNHGISSGGWTLEEGYKEDTPFETYPLRGMGSGASTGLTLVLKASQDDLDYYCRGPVQGFIVSLHTPVEFPRVSQKYFRIPLNQEVIASVKPNMMTTSETLREYEPERRQCFFPNERKLDYFAVYTQQNCELECLSLYTYLMCGCVPLSLPKDLEAPVCSAGSVQCASRARDDLITRAIKTNLEKNIETDEMQEALNEIASQCNCLPACTVIDYDVEISQADYNWRKVYQAYKENFTGVEIARMVLFFKQPQFTTSKRSELYGQTDFLANCGGLLGLCLGFSILSLIEIIYFLTIRAFFNISRHFMKKRRWDEGKTN